MQEALIVTGLDYAPSERTVDILPQMLGNADLSPCSFSPDTPLPLRHPPIFQEISTTTIANNNNNPTTENPSKAKSMASSSSSSTSSSDSTNILRTEISSLKNEVKTMGLALGELIREMKLLTQKINIQITTATDNTYTRNNNENQPPPSHRDSYYNHQSRHRPDNQHNSHNFRREPYYKKHQHF